MAVQTPLSILQTDANLVRDYLAWTYQARELLDDIVCKYRKWEDLDDPEYSFLHKEVFAAENLLKKWEDDIDRSPSIG